MLLLWTKTDPLGLRVSARLGNANLTNGNENVRSRSGDALGVVREGAARPLLDTGTETACGYAGVKTRPQNSLVVKLESVPQLTLVTDLMHGEDSAGRDGAEMEQQQSSGHRPEGFCCSVMVGYDGFHCSEVADRSSRREMNAHRDAHLVLERPV